MIFCLMGPTACGKTQLAIELVRRFPFEIISVDSAMVYRDMNIGTAKPSVEILQLAPHRLIDIRDPKDSYSVGNFYHDVWCHIEDIRATGKMPLLVGGTMMYFNALMNGLAHLPSADAHTRQLLQQRAENEGWQKLYDELVTVDSVAASRIEPYDKQRIQRALEVYYLTGQPISSFQQQKSKQHTKYVIHQIGLIPQNRTWLHQRIALRFAEMLAQGFIAEGEKLAARTDLNRDLPSLRAVGYRELLSYLASEISYEDMREKSIIATRQLAKRQLTWLRSFDSIHQINADAPDVLDQVCDFVQKKMNQS